MWSAGGLAGLGWGACTLEGERSGEAYQTIERLDEMIRRIEL
jgi:hypothetical protein